MISALKGKILFKHTDRVVVDVQGVGYEVFLTTDGVAQLGDEGEDIFLHIQTNVREDAITLFGFLSAQEKELFLILRTVSGIGPKVALGVLSGMPLSELCGAIASSDIKRLTTLPGVGKKTAERICVELKDKMGSFAGDTLVTTPLASGVGSTMGAALADALSALTNLGYSDPVARDALARVKADVEGSEQDVTVEFLIREGLKVLA